MDGWRKAFRRGVVTGSISSIGSAIALGLYGKWEGGTQYSAVNAVSHWVWGDPAFRKNGLSLRHTALGYLIHHASATFWAVLHEKWFGKNMDRMSAAPLLATSALMSGVACFTDYRLTPKRLQPGYEARLSRQSVLLVYCVFGLGLALGAHLVRRDEPL